MTGFNIVNETLADRILHDTPSFDSFAVLSY